MKVGDYIQVVADTDKDGSYDFHSVPIGSICRITEIRNYDPTIIVSTYQGRKVEFYKEEYEVVSLQLELFDMEK